MKSYYNRHTKFRTLSPKDKVIAWDHLSKEKWRTGTIVSQQAPVSSCIQLDDGRLWRHHIDDLLKGPFQNRASAPQVSTAIQAPPVVQEPLIPVVSPDLLRTLGPRVTASADSSNSFQKASQELQPVVEQAGTPPAPKAKLAPLQSLQSSSPFVSRQYNSKKADY